MSIPEYITPRPDDRGIRHHGPRRLHGGWDEDRIELIIRIPLEES